MQCSIFVGSQDCSKRVLKASFTFNCSGFTYSEDRRQVIPSLKALRRHSCLVHFVFNANYASLLAIKLEKSASCQAIMSSKHYIKRYKKRNVEKLLG